MGGQGATILLSLTEDQFHKHCGVKQDLSRRVFGRKGYHHPGANSSNREIGFRILRV